MVGYNIPIHMWTQNLNCTIYVDYHFFFLFPRQNLYKYYIKSDVVPFLSNDKTLLCWQYLR
jgi:hypothetical protein